MQKSSLDVKPQRQEPASTAGGWPKFGQATDDGRLYISVEQSTLKLPTTGEGSSGIA